MKPKATIYLACPCSHDDPEVRAQRLIAAKNAATSLEALGHTVISPVSQLPNFYMPAEKWEVIERAFIEWVDHFVMIDKDDCWISGGVRAGFNIACEIDKPISLVSDWV